MENLKFVGNLTLTLKDENGNVKQEEKVKNLIVNSGLGYIIDRIHGVKKEEALPVLSHIAIGSGTTAKDKAQTKLVTEVVRVKAKAEKLAYNKIRYSVTFIEGVGTAVLNEAGIFNSADEKLTGDKNIMFSRTTFGTITKEAKDTLTIIWEIEVQS